MNITTHDVISDFPMFHGLAPVYVDRLASESKIIHLSRDAILFNRGDHTPGFYILTSGQIKLAISSAQGAEKIMDIITPGRSFGEAITFLDRTAPVTAQAIQVSTLILVPRKTLFALLQEDPNIACSIISSLAARMHQLVSNIESISMLSGAQRLVGYLLQMVSQSPGTSTLKLASSKANIASLLNISPETLSRIMHKLTEDGLIAVYGREIDILNLEGLRNYQGDL
ncbi:transcriptional activator protein Anr [mine drainage metagenome]|uniref:Transcriptional activator protein Anr n=1 Tax=mine drainage metagenome TaxID=410659 RepID=A0A1J5PXF2_9ZZZZ